jgi:hypothetical protein
MEFGKFVFHLRVTLFHYVKMSKFTQNLMKPIVNYDAFPNSVGLKGLGFYFFEKVNNKFYTIII